MTDRSAFGLYLHIPFCRKKCAYCDFYSAIATDELLDRYTKALQTEIRKWGGATNRPIRSIYFGGGTPSLLGNRLPPIMNTIRDSFSLLPNTEITLEVNPSGRTETLLAAAKSAGVNRLSIGAQSGDNKTLALLGRTHTAADTLATVKAARRLGFENLSLDLMLGLPFSNEATLQNDLDFMLSAEPEHLSAYLLKIEPRTRFFAEQASLSLPDDDQQAAQYLLLCDVLKQHGYRHYEISNFSKPGFEGRHNLGYWQTEEYLGLGPAAHSFFEGKRFYYPKNLKAFLTGADPVADGAGGGKDEYLMLRLRLAEGVNFCEYRQTFGEDIADRLTAVCLPFAKAGLAAVTKDGVALTDRGMLVSNSIITACLDAL